MTQKKVTIGETSFESVIGRRIEAEANKSMLSSAIEKSLDEDVEPLYGPQVTITVSDVDWDDSKQLTLNASELKRIGEDLNL